MNDKQFDVVTEVLPAEEAETAFRRHLLELGIDFEDLDLDEGVVVDTFCSNDGVIYRRYHLRSSLNRDLDR